MFVLYLALFCCCASRVMSEAVVVMTRTENEPAFLPHTVLSYIHSVIVINITTIRLF
jgi:hypothetical protein